MLARAALQTAPSRGQSDTVVANTLAIVGINGLVVVGLWWRHGGLATVHGAGGPATAVGQVSGLLATYLVLLELLLMARVPWFERRLGLDRLARWHRWNGFALVWLVILHVVTITLGYAATTGSGIPAQVGDFVRHYPDVLMAIVGTGMLVAVAATSVRAARARLSREAWYFVHLYVYLAVALTFAHQLAVGSDFVSDPVARAWWVAMYVAVGLALLLWRVGWPMWFNARHQLRVAKVSVEGPGVASIHVTGRDLAAVNARPGQFFIWRFLTRDHWYKAHPFSLSAVPDDRRLRITVKELGDFTSEVRSISRGTRVFAEGPYGAFTRDRVTRPKVLLIAGGIGITPIRALVDELSAQSVDVVLLYRVQRESDVVFRDELDRLARERAIPIRVLVGTDIGDDWTDQLGVQALPRLVPDIAERDVFVCGPPGLVDAVRRRLRRLGVPRRQIHAERFSY